MFSTPNPGIVSESALHLTCGVPVVWLTANIDATGWLCTYHRDTVVLVVDAKKKHLRHWRTWVSEIEGGKDVLRPERMREEGRF